MAYLPEGARVHVAWDWQVHHERLARGVPRARVWEHVVGMNADELIAVVVTRAEDLLGPIAVVQIYVNHAYAGTLPLGPDVLGGGGGVVQQTEAQPQLQGVHIDAAQSGTMDGTVFGSPKRKKPHRLIILRLAASPRMVARGPTSHEGGVGSTAHDGIHGLGQKETPRLALENRERGGPGMASCVEV